MSSDESSGSDFESDFREFEDDTEYPEVATGWEDGDDLKAPFAFSGEPGIIAANFENEVNAFRHILSDEMIPLVIDETNRFCRALQGLAKAPNSRSLLWEDVMQFKWNHDIFRHALDNGSG